MASAARSFELENGMPIRSLALRNVIAEAILAALVDRGEVGALRALAAVLADESKPIAPELARRLAASGAFAPPGEQGTPRVRLRPAIASERDEALERVTRALAAVERYFEAPVSPASDHLERALVQAAVLFDARLFFEVHEILEAVWRTLDGAPRRFVQGLIQVAVAFHHLENGNRAGARTLLAEGRMKLAPFAPVFRGVGVGQLLADTELWQRALDLDDAIETLAVPRLAVDRPSGLG